MDHHSTRTLTRDGFEAEGLGDALVEAVETEAVKSPGKTSSTPSTSTTGRRRGCRCSTGRAKWRSRAGSRRRDRVMHGALALRPALVRRLVALARKPGLHAPGRRVRARPGEGLPDASRDAVIADIAVYREIGKLARRHAQVESVTSARTRRARPSSPWSSTASRPRSRQPCASSTTRWAGRVLLELDQDWKRLLRSLHRAEKALEGERARKQGEEARGDRRAAHARRGQRDPTWRGRRRR